MKQGEVAVLSMTGFGTGDAALEIGQLSVSVRAVNHRFLDVRTRASSDLGEHTSVAEEVVRKRLVRGRVEIAVRLVGSPARARLDVDRARTAFEEIARLRDALSPGEPLPLSLLSCVPDLFAAREPVDADEARTALAAATAAACDAVLSMRRTEGAAIEQDLAEHLAEVRALVSSVKDRYPVVVTTYGQKLRERVERLLSEVPVALDPGRLEHEVALFADRADVDEEITRLQSHADQVSSLFGAEEAVGRKLEFLLQEMAREINTIGAKCADTKVTHAVVEMKAELERMREQAQNVL